MANAESSFSNVSFTSVGNKLVALSISIPFRATFWSHINHIYECNSSHELYIYFNLFMKQNPCKKTYNSIIKSI